MVNNSLTLRPSNSALHEAILSVDMLRHAPVPSAELSLVPRLGPHIVDQRQVAKVRQ